MDRLLQLFRTNEFYQKDVSKYGIIDGIIAIALYIFLMIAYYLMGLYQANTNIYLGDPVSLLLIALCILVVVLRKNGIQSIGFQKKNAVKSIVLGFVLGIFLVAGNIAVGLENGKIFAPIQTILLNLFYYLFIISLTEEIIFRGFIQSRIFGLIHNNLLATVLVAIMFVLSHIPYHMSAVKMTLLQFCQHNGTWFISLFVLHLLFTYLYRKYNSIFASTVFHALMDWSNDLFM